MAVGVFGENRKNHNLPKLKAPNIFTLCFSLVFRPLHCNLILLRAMAYDHSKVTGFIGMW